MQQLEHFCISKKKNQCSLALLISRVLGKVYSVEYRKLESCLRTNWKAL